MLTPFSFARIPPIHCGVGTLAKMGPWLQEQGSRRVLLVTGARSLERQGHLTAVEAYLAAAGVDHHRVIGAGEPSVAVVDELSRRWHGRDIDAVIAIGGGSVVDLGKALAAMVPHGNSVLDHLEGVGRDIAHSGISLPLLAIPTTSGTGGEVSKNAVISEVGPQGFKKSLRHERFIPAAVILDGALLTGADAALTAACGLDALTQLLEPFLSPIASPLSDAIVWSGLEQLLPNLRAACGDGADDPQVRLAVAYGALCSGIGLANAGLGIVHGLAGPLGGWFPIPHGVACGTLIGAAQRQTWQALRSRAPDHPALGRMARVGRLLNGGEDLPDAEAAAWLTTTLEAWVDELALPRLGAYGIGEGDLERLVAAADNRQNPIALEPAEIRTLVEQRL